MSKNEPTTTDILQAIHSFSSDVDKRFDGIDKRFENIDGKFVSINKRFENIENDLKIVKSTMVTKAYLDEKLLDLRGDMTVLIRKEDNKL